MIVKNVKVRWAHVQAPDTKYQARWKVDLLPEGDNLTKLQEAGLVMKEDKKTGEQYYQATRNAMYRNGDKNSPPRVVNLQKQPITDLIGNGSICNVILDIREVDNFGTPMMKGYLEAVQVVDLVVYAGNEDFDDPDENNTEDF